MLKIPNPLKTMDNYLSKPMKTRRWLIVLTVMVSLGLIIYVNIKGTPLEGETLLMTLLGGTGGIYGASHLWKNGNTKNGE